MPAPASSLPTRPMAPRHTRTCQVRATYNYYYASHSLPCPQPCFVMTRFQLARVRPLAPAPALLQQASMQGSRAHQQPDRTTTFKVSGVVGR